MAPEISVGDVMGGYYYEGLWAYDLRKLNLGLEIVAFDIGSLREGKVLLIEPGRPVTNLGRPARIMPSAEYFSRMVRNQTEVSYSIMVGIKQAGDNKIFVGTDKLSAREGFGNVWLYELASSRDWREPVAGEDRYAHWQGFIESPVAVIPVPWMSGESDQSGGVLLVSWREFQDSTVEGNIGSFFKSRYLGMKMGRKE